MFSGNNPRFFTQIQQKQLKFLRKKVVTLLIHDTLQGTVEYGATFIRLQK